MSAASPQVKTMAPQVKNLYCGFSPGSPSVICPMGEKLTHSDTIRTPSPMAR